MRARVPAKSKTQHDVAKLMKEQGAALLGEAKAERYRELLAELKKMKQEEVPADYALCVTEMGPVARKRSCSSAAIAHLLGPRSVDPRFPRILDRGRGNSLRPDRAKIPAAGGWCWPIGSPRPTTR